MVMTIRLPHIASSSFQRLQRLCTWNDRPEAVEHSLVRRCTFRKEEGEQNMPEHPNVATYRRVHEKIQRGDFEAVFEALDDEVVWHQIGAETLLGKEAVRQTMSGMEEFGADAFDIVIHDVVGNDEHVVGLVEATVN